MESIQGTLSGPASSYIPVEKTRALKILVGVGISSSIIGAIIGSLAIQKK